MAPRILVVEDEALIRLDLAEHLRDCGFDVLEAADADQAREVLGAAPDIDVVLTDVQMPGSMDGVALARLIGEQRPEIKVVIVSGAWRPGRGAPSVAAVLDKPVPLHSVVRLLEWLTEPQHDVFSG